MKGISLILLGIGIMIIPGIGFAEDNAGDCVLFDKGAERGIITSNYTTIYPQKNVDIAIKNLKNYCCNEHLIINGEICKDNSDKDGVSSNLLYDHIIDVGFRSLDGEKTLYYTIPQTQIGDTIGEEWKKKITEYATNPLGAIPVKIWSDFGKYRGFDMQGGVSIILQEEKDCENNKEQYAGYEKNRNNNPNDASQSSVGLAEKYLVICHMAQCIKHNQINNYYQACKNIALQRIQDEMDYVQTLTINQGLQGLISNFNAYTQGYFVQGQLSQLLEKITEMNAGLTHINSKVHEMTKMCSS